jgi:hypothetical protein
MKSATPWRRSSVLEERGPQALLFEGPHEAFGHSVALGLTDEGRVVGDAQPSERSLEVPRSVLASPVVTELDAPGVEPRPSSGAADHRGLVRAEVLGSLAVHRHECLLTLRYSVSNDPGCTPPLDVARQEP